MSETIYLQSNEFNASNKPYTTIFYSYLIFKLKLKTAPFSGYPKLTSSTSINLADFSATERKFFNPE